MLSVDPTALSAFVALIIAAWAGWSARRQAAGTEQQAITARVQELETLYVARLEDLQAKYEAVQRDCELFRRHAQRCEEDIAELRLSVHHRHAGGGYEQ